MSTSSEQEQTLLEKLRALPPEKVVEVEDFVDFLCERAERSRLTHTFTTLSEDAFQKIWDNPDDAAYDQL